MTNDILTNDISTNAILTNDISTNDTLTNDTLTNDISTNAILTSPLNPRQVIHWFLLPMIKLYFYYQTLTLKNANQRHKS